MPSWTYIIVIDIKTTNKLKTLFILYMYKYNENDRNTYPQGSKLLQNQSSTNTELIFPDSW